jgi:hypothetical protein
MAVIEHHLRRARLSTAIRLPGSRITNLLLLAMLLSVADGFGATLAASHFLSTVGSNGIVVDYVIFAALSIPVSMIMAPAINRGSRAALLERLLLGAVPVSAVLILASVYGGAIGAYVLFSGLPVIHLVIASVFQVMLGDYMTVREISRYSVRLSVAMSSGVMLGSLLAVGLVTVFDPVWLTFGLLPLQLLCFGHLSWLATQWQPAGEWEAQEEEGVMESLRGIGRLLRGFPIALLLVVAVFANMLTQCSSEYLVYTIYTDHFPDEQALARFFGIMKGVVNFAGMAVGLWLSDPLMRRLGIARMNLVFPVASGLGFVGMAISPALALGIMAHVVYAGLADTIDVPVMTINYNAVPPRFSGRLRVFNDNIVYPFALALSGFLLWAVDAVAGFSGVAVMGGVLSLVFLAASWGIGRRYVSGLVGMLREGTVDLDRDDALARTAPDIVASHPDALRALLGSNDRGAVTLALRILAHVPLASFRDALAPALASGADEPVACLAAAGARLGPDLLPLFAAGSPTVRRGAARCLVAAGVALPEAPPGETDKVLAALRGVAAAERNSASRDALVAAIADIDIAAALLPVVAARGRPASIPILIAIADHHPALESPALRRLAALPPSLIEEAPLDERLIRRALAAPIPPERLAGWRLAAAQGWSVERLVQGLDDADDEVREGVADLLIARGGAAIDAAAAVLESGTAAARLAAIHVLGRLGETERLFAALKTGAFRRIETHRFWRAALPDGTKADWSRIAGIAMAEADQAAIEEVLATLAALGHRQTVLYVRRFLAATDQRMRARAIEAIGAVDQRQLVGPLIPLLDGGGDAVKGKSAALPSVLASMAGNESPWLRRAAAAAALAGQDGFTLPELSRTDMDAAHPDLIAQLLFLRDVSIFRHCSLDDLLSIDKALVRNDYLDGEAIITAGQEGDELFVLQQGEARVSLTTEGKTVEFARFQPGAVFGEMALFDQSERSADVTAVGRTLCLVLGRSRFEDLTRQRPAILMQICRVFAERLREANNRLQKI